MAVIQSGDVGAAQANVGAAAAVPLHAAPKPHPYGVFGHYQLAIQTGAIAAGAASNSELLHFRWTDTLRSAHIARVWLTGIRATTAFAVGTIDVMLTRATAWTANGTGGTSLTISSPSFELRQAPMGVTGVADLRIATTAALGVGTKTLDTYDMGQITTHSSGGVGSATPIIGSIYLPTLELFTAYTEAGFHPLSLDPNEGFVVRATVPATGVWNIGIAIKWAELAAGTGF
jgi:hypothetical protein